MVFSTNMSRVQISHFPTIKLTKKEKEEVSDKV